MTHPPLPTRYGSSFVQTAAGLCALAVVMGIGRFLYTALLPGMMATHALDESTAGIMAAWNYAGYLAGVLAMRGQGPGYRRYGFFIAFLIVSVASTVAMGLGASVFFWHGMRFVSGFASGACFVLCSSIVLDALTAAGKPELAGFLYSGVGTGIALGGLAAPFLEGRLGVDGAWIVAGIACVPLAFFSIAALSPAKTPYPVAPEQSSGPQRPSGTGNRKAYRVLLTAYFLEGFGYIIGTTFLVAQVRLTTGSARLAGVSWVITGIAAAVSAPLWRMAAKRGYLPMLITAFVLQGVGSLLPVVSQNAMAVFGGGLLLGGTFMGISVLSLQYGVQLSGRPSAYTIAIMTALYGVGQILGPFVAGMTAGEGEGFAFSFALSSAALFAAAAILVLGARTPDGSTATKVEQP